MSKNQQHGPQGHSLESLLLRFRDHGDTDALTELFDTAAPGLRRLARRLTGPRRHDLADDALQETFLALVEKPERFDESRRLLPWLASVLVNRLRRLQEREARVFDESRLTEREVNSPEDSALYSELAAHVESEVGKLPTTVREAVHGKVLRGEDVEVLSRELGISSGAFRVRLHRGLNRLRAALPKSLLGVLGVLGLRDRSYAAIRARVLSAGGASTGQTVISAWAVIGFALFSTIGTIWWLSKPDSENPNHKFTTIQPEAAHSGESAEARQLVALTSLEPDSDRMATGDTSGGRLAKLRVTVIDPGDGSPRDGVSVRLLYGSAEELPERVASTGASGVVEFDIEPFRTLWKLQIDCRADAPSVHRFLRGGMQPGDLREETLKLGEGGSLSGRVVDTRGKPVARATVQMWCNSSARGPVARSVLSDEGGRYRLEHVGERFVLRAVAEGLASHTGLSGRIENLANHGAMDLIVAPAVILRGRVVDEAGEPIEGVLAVMPNDLGADASWMKTEVPGVLAFKDAEGSAVSDGTGRFQIAGLPEAERRVNFEHPACDGMSSDIAAPFTKEKLFVLKGALRVRGRIVGANGQPANGARIRGWPRREGSHGIKRWIEADEQGRFVMSGFIRPREGGYNTTPGLVVRHEGHALHSVTGFIPGVSARSELVIRMGEIARSISGRVVDSSGSPLRGIEVWAVGSRMCDTGTRWNGQPSTCEYAAGLSKTKTNEMGEFEFGELYPDIFELRAFDPRDQTRWVTEKVASDSRDVEVALTDEALQKVVLIGMVHRATNGFPISEFSIHPMRDLDGSGSEGNIFEFDDETGMFRVEGLQPGLYELIARAEGFAEEKKSIQFLSDGEYRFEFDLCEQRELTVQLKLGEGVSEGFDVTARNRDGGEIWFTKGNGSSSHAYFRAGEVVLRGLPAKTIVLTVGSDLRSQEIEVDLTLARQEPLVVRFDSLPTVNVDYVVLEADRDVVEQALKENLLEGPTKEGRAWWSRNRGKIGPPLGDFVLEFSTEEGVRVARDAYTSQGDGTFARESLSFYPSNSSSSSSGGSAPGGHFVSPSEKLLVEVSSQYYETHELSIEVGTEPSDFGSSTLILLRRP